jgi:hypothetical protein
MPAMLRLLCAVLLLAAPASARKGEVEEPFGVVALLPAGLDTPTKQYLMDAAARANRRLMRVELPFDKLHPEPDVWQLEDLDETVTMAAQRGITLVGMMRGTAVWVADARSADMRRGPVAANKYGDFRDHAKYLARRYELIRYWEIWPGADDPKKFLGTAPEFARLFEAASKGIKSGNGDAQVLLPSPAGSIDTAYLQGSWLDQVITDKKYPARKRFDGAALRLRLPLNKLPDAVRSAREYLDTIKREKASVWVVDLGFPATVAQQKVIDAGFATGEGGQAAYYERALPTLRNAGAEAVLVPLNDLPWSDKRCSGATFPLSACSEGLVTFPDGKKGSRDRASLAVIQKL